MSKEYRLRRWCKQCKKYYYEKHKDKKPKFKPKSCEAAGHELTPLVIEKKKEVE